MRAPRVGQTSGTDDVDLYLPKIAKIRHNTPALRWYPALDMENSYDIDDSSPKISVYNTAPLDPKYRGTIVITMEHEIQMDLDNFVEFFEPDVVEEGDKGSETSRNLLDNRKNGLSEGLLFLLKNHHASRMSWGHFLIPGILHCALFVSLIASRKVRDTLFQNNDHLKKKFRTVVCKHWLSGTCMKGDGCEFLHKMEKNV